MVKLWFAKVRPDGVIPSKRDEDAGYDIFLDFDGEYIRLEPHETKLLPTGIASAFEPGYYFQIQERGERFNVYYITKAVCQAVLLPVPETEITEIPYDELMEMKSLRMTGSLGSSGK